MTQKEGKKEQKKKKSSISGQARQRKRKEGKKEEQNDPVGQARRRAVASLGAPRRQWCSLGGLFFCLFVVFRLFRWYVISRQTRTRVFFPRAGASARVFFPRVWRVLCVLFYRRAPGEPRDRGRAVCGGDLEWTPL